eukprot:Nk52_evm4s2402 gene=Nk52_evmTU4s2402
MDLVEPRSAQRDRRCRVPDDLFIVETAPSTTGEMVTMPLRVLVEMHLAVHLNHLLEIVFHLMPGTPREWVYSDILREMEADPHVALYIWMAIQPPHPLYDGIECENSQCKRIALKKNITCEMLLPPSLPLAVGDEQPSSDSDGKSTANAGKDIPIAPLVCARYNELFDEFVPADTVPNLFDLDGEWTPCLKGECTDVLEQDKKTISVLKRERYKLEEEVDILEKQGTWEQSETAILVLRDQIERLKRDREAWKKEWDATKLELEEARKTWHEKRDEFTEAQVEAAKRAELDEEAEYTRIKREELMGDIETCQLKIHSDIIPKTTSVKADLKFMHEKIYDVKEKRKALDKKSEQSKVDSRQCKCNFLKAYRLNEEESKQYNCFTSSIVQNGFDEFNYEHKNEYVSMYQSLKQSEVKRCSSDISLHVSADSEWLSENHLLSGINDESTCDTYFPIQPENIVYDENLASDNEDQSHSFYDNKYWGGIHAKNCDLQKVLEACKKKESDISGSDSKENVYNWRTCMEKLIKDTIALEDKNAGKLAIQKDLLKQCDEEISSLNEEHQQCKDDIDRGKEKVKSIASGCEQTRANLTQTANNLTNAADTAKAKEDLQDGFSCIEPSSAASKGSKPKKASKPNCITGDQAKVNLLYAVDSRAGYVKRENVCLSKILLARVSQVGYYYFLSNEKDTSLGNGFESRMVYFDKSGAKRLIKTIHATGEGARHFGLFSEYYFKDSDENNVNNDNSFFNVDKNSQCRLERGCIVSRFGGLPTPGSNFYEITLIGQPTSVNDGEDDDDDERFYARVTPSRQFKIGDIGSQFTELGDADRLDGWVSIEYRILDGPARYPDTRCMIKVSYCAGKPSFTKDIITCSDSSPAPKVLACATVDDLFQTEKGASSSLRIGADEILKRPLYVGVMCSTTDCQYQVEKTLDPSKSIGLCVNDNCFAGKDSRACYKCSTCDQKGPCDTDTGVCSEFASGWRLRQQNDDRELSPVSKESFEMSPASSADGEPKYEKVSKEVEEERIKNEWLVHRVRFFALSSSQDWVPIVPQPSDALDIGHENDNYDPSVMTLSDEYGPQKALIPSTEDENEDDDTPDEDDYWHGKTMTLPDGNAKVMYAAKEMLVQCRDKYVDDPSEVLKQISYLKEQFQITVEKMHTIAKSYDDSSNPVDEYIKSQTKDYKLSDKSVSKAFDAFRQAAESKEVNKTDVEAKYKTLKNSITEKDGLYPVVYGALSELCKYETGATHYLNKAAGNSIFIGIRSPHSGWKFAIGKVAMIEKQDTTRALVLETESKNKKSGFYEYEHLLGLDFRTPKEWVKKMLEALKKDRIDNITQESPKVGAPVMSSKKPKQYYQGRLYLFRVLCVKYEESTDTLVKRQKRVYTGDSRWGWSRRDLVYPRFPRVDCEKVDKEIPLEVYHSDFLTHYNIEKNTQTNKCLVFNFGDTLNLHPTIPCLMDKVKDTIMKTEYEEGRSVQPSSPIELTDTATVTGKPDPSKMARPFIGSNTNTNAKSLDLSEDKNQCADILGGKFPDVTLSDGIKALCQSTR